MRPEAPSFAAFDSYREYGAALSGLLSNWADSSMAAVDSHLDGEAYRALRESVPIADRRKASTFFSSSALRQQLTRPYSSEITAGARVHDPACGAGDLLISAVELLGGQESRKRPKIPHQISGSEIIPTLAEAATLRLAIAWRRFVSEGPLTVPPPIDITATDGLCNNVNLAEADIVLLNPPFFRSKVLGEVWAQGLVTQAAPFTLKVLQACQPGATVAAILPDVLRFGPRYAKWRVQVHKIASWDASEIVGAFDSWTGRDVFIGRFRKYDSAREPTIPISEHQTTPVRTGTLGDIASVTVGDVVPHRDEETGPKVSYLTPAAAPINGEIKKAPVRRYAGRLHSGPFVTLRRTSAATDTKPRLLPSIATAQLGQTAVENHLIIVKPLNNSLQACRKLAESLQSPHVTTWLNARTRTRHLSCAILRDLPLSTLGGAGIELLGPR